MIYNTTILQYLDPKLRALEVKPSDRAVHAPAHFPRFPLYPGDACLAPLELLLDSEQLVLILLLISAPVPDLSLEFFISCLVSLYPALLDMVLIQVDTTATRSARYDAWSPYLTCSR